jgi:uncharacterized protein YnzC (UPF0291/DUF896 family)
MMPFGAIGQIFHKELGPVNKLKQLSKEQKEERVKLARAFINPIQNQGKAFLDYIIFMDEPAKL